MNYLKLRQPILRSQIMPFNFQNALRRLVRTNSVAAIASQPYHNFRDAVTTPDLVSTPFLPTTSEDKAHFLECKLFRLCIESIRKNQEGSFDLYRGRFRQMDAPRSLPRSFEEEVCRRIGQRLAQSHYLHGIEYK